jgi:hypothetical protein
MIHDVCVLDYRAQVERLIGYVPRHASGCHHAFGTPAERAHRSYENSNTTKEKREYLHPDPIDVLQ